MKNGEKTTGDQHTEKPLVVVTGSSGLIGKTLLDALVGRYRCVGLDKAGNPHGLKEVETIFFDIADTTSIRHAFDRIRFAYGYRIASVVHLAAYYDFSGEPSPLYDEITVEGTGNLLKALDDFEVEQFVFSSTNLVYKPAAPGKKIDEKAPLDPTWNYPASKVKTEELIREKRGNIPVAILRIAGAYDDLGHSIPVSHQIQRIYEKKLTSYFYPGDLLHGNAFVHLDDLVDALVRTVDRRNELPHDLALNISEPETIAYEELQNTIGELVHGKAWPTLKIPKPIAKAGAWAQDLVGDPFIKPWMVDRADDHYEMDVSHAGKYLNWSPRHNLRSTLPEMIRQLKADPEKWYRENNLDN